VLLQPLTGKWWTHAKLGGFFTQSLFMFEGGCFLIHSGFALYALGVIPVQTKVCNSIRGNFLGVQNP